MRGIFDCPGCGAGIAFPAATVRKVRCPACGATIGVTFADDAAEVTANVSTWPASARLGVATPPKAAVKAVPSAHRKSEQVAAEPPAAPSPPPKEERPRKRLRREKRPAKSRSSIVLVAAGGFLLMLLLAGGVVMIVSRGGRKDGAVPAGGSAVAAGAPAGGGAANVAPEPDGKGVLNAARPKWSVPPGTPVRDAQLPKFLEIDNVDSFRILNAEGDFIGLDRRGVVRGRVGKDGRATDVFLLEAGSGNQCWSAEVSPGGTLAMPVPELSSIQFWDAGQSKPRAVDGPPIEGLTWFRWATKDRLIAVYASHLPYRDPEQNKEVKPSPGRLIAWDAAHGKQVFKLDEEFDAVVDAAPGGQWIVAAVRPPNWLSTREVKTDLRVYSTATGDVIGRLSSRGHWTRLSVSPDGKELLGLRSVAHLSDLGGVEVFHWDMTTGTELGTLVFDYGISRTQQFRWWGPGRVLMVSSQFTDPSGTLIDLQTHSFVSHVQFPRPNPNEGPPVKALLWSPDRRPWWLGVPRGNPAAKSSSALKSQTHLFTVACPEPDLNGAALKPGSTIDIELKCPEDRRERVKEALAAVLKREGYKIGASDWKLRVTAAQEPSGATMEFPATRLKAPVPMTTGTVELLGPNGASVGRADFRVPFGGSAYLMKYTTKGGPNNLTLIYEFDFKGKDPVQVMTEEVWAGLAVELGRGSWPRLAWLRDGKFTTTWPSVKLQLPEFLR
jgi:hypothetical protein